MPPRIAKLPLSERGYPVPFFVAWIDGKPDFRIVDARKAAACAAHRLCFVCGTQLGKFQTFPIGPMCTVNRISSEPPSHLECCEWSVRACPFLLRPNMVRRENDLPEDRKITGIGIARNPGVTALWTVKKYTIQHVGRGRLFSFGDPEKVSWWAEGRPATRAEVEESIRTGLPALRALCANDKELGELSYLETRAKLFLPP